MPGSVRALIALVPHACATKYDRPLSLITFKSTIESLRRDGRSEAKRSRTRPQVHDISSLPDPASS
jgi:hypothetical protein